jgi:hypothetical protein
MGIAASKKTLFAQHLPAPLLAYFAGNACRHRFASSTPLKRQSVISINSGQEQGAYRFKHRNRNFPREVTMATIRKGSKQFTRWFKSYCEANKPPYRWYEHGTYVA